MTKPKMVIIATIPDSILISIKGLPRMLAETYEVKLVTSPGENIAKLQQAEGIPVTSIKMTRKITPLQDLAALCKLIAFLRNEKPEIVYSFTPKAGLLATIAAFIARVPIRIHNIVGLPLMEKKGLVKVISTLSEKTTYFFATHLLCNSLKLRDYIHQYVSNKKIDVIGEGSINGINTEYFKNNLSKVERAKARAKLNFLEEDCVVIFAGRVVRDKGIQELVQAFIELPQPFSYLKLLIVGDYEPSLDPLDAKTLHEIAHNENIQSVGFQSDVGAYLALADICILPSYREGFPHILMEAGSYGLPLLGTDINGCNEIIQDGVNGLLFPKKSVSALKEAMIKMVSDPDLYMRLKSNARASIVARYAQEKFWTLLKQYLKRVSK
jgi:glycosyltransferase involved in cell wall biosynthesis